MTSSLCLFVWVQQLYDWLSTHTLVFRGWVGSMSSTNYHYGLLVGLRYAHFGRNVRRLFEDVFINQSHEYFLFYLEHVPYVASGRCIGHRTSPLHDVKSRIISELHAFCGYRCCNSFVS